LGQRINSLWKQNRKIYPHPQIETVENSKEIAEAEFIIPPGCSIWVEDGPLICWIYFFPYLCPAWFSSVLPQAYE